MSKKYKPKFLINEEMVQEEAKSCLDRELTDDEVEQVFEAICEQWMEFVQDRIHWVDDFNEMLERNEGAEKELVHFDVHHRNKNAYRFEFALMNSFKTEADARTYIHHDFITEFDEWKIYRVEGEKTQQVWSINVKP